ncbi:MAG: D-TA family PLP-dependent enzyme, partial [Candidatus Muiribacteriota bacterium]
MQSVYNISTPYVLAYIEIINRNIKKMQTLAGNNNLSLMPHFKTHKSGFFARKQIENGAVGITCAKLSEVEVLIKNNVKNILLAYPLVGELKYQKLLNLLNYAHISLMFDNDTQIKKF